jgi:CheY-like chemotaxis protein
VQTSNLPLGFRNRIATAVSADLTLHPLHSWTGTFRERPGEGHARPEAAMFFTFPEDARWNAERQAVEFGVIIGEYEGVVPVPRRVFQRLLPERPTPSGASKPTNLGLTPTPPCRRRKKVTATATLMLVDDADTTRLLIREVLTHFGYPKIIEAGDGATALDLFTNGSERIDLLITDIAHPGMDGVALIRAVRAIDPDIKVIVVSGQLPHNEDEVRRRLDGENRTEAATRSRQ